MTTTTAPAPFFNAHSYTDVTPYELIRVVSNKCVEVREMKAEMDPSYTPERIPGGFAGVCVNQNAQKWVITSDERQPVIRIRLHKDGFWRAARGVSRFKPAETPRYYYDFNF